MAYRKIISITSGAFSAGFGLSWYLFKNKKNETVRLKDDYNEPIFTSLIPRMTLKAEVAPPINTNSIVPIKPGSKDTASLNTSNRMGELMKHGYPSLDNLRIFENYALSYDRRTRVPNWVFERLTSFSIKPGENVDRGKSDFKEDTHIHPYFRSRNQDYRGSGFDRGHMAAAANHRSNQKHMDETFYLCNIAPQVGEGFNRDKWNDLEKYTRSLVKKYENLWVCTGPLYLPKLEADSKLYVKYEVIGTQNIAVPTHYFKVILGENKDGNYDLFSYVLPNSYCPKETPLESYLVPIDSIERAAGFLLFDRVLKSKMKLVNGK